MMPVFFPFTFMTEAILKAFSRFFETIVVFQATGKQIPGAMKEWQAKKVIDIRVPQADDEKISALLKDYRTWAQQHQGRDISVHKYYRARVPFFADTSIARIKKDIRGAAADGVIGKDADKENLLLRARLFLQMAQEFDRQSLEISRSLMAQSVMEQRLFEGLKGEKSTSAGIGSGEPLPPAAEPFGYMLADRLREWARLMLSHGKIEGLYVTHRRDVVEAAMGAVLQDPSGTPLQRIPAFSSENQGITGRQRSLMEYIRQLNRMSVVDLRKGRVPEFTSLGYDEEPTLQLFVAPGMTPHAFFSRLVSKDATVCEETDSEMAIKNTILGLVGPAV